MSLFKSKIALLSTLIALAGLSAVAHAADADPDLVFAGTPYEGDVTGNINVVSKYILRGITQTYGTSYNTADAANSSTAPESASPAVQGGLDYVLKNGLYVGYWFSTLGYSYAGLNPDSNGKHNQNSVENDLYGGYNGTIGSTGIGYTVGGTIYVYEPGWASTGYETKLGLNYSEVAVTAQTLLNDVSWGNTGDTYFLATWTHALPRDFTFTGQVGAYLYGKHGDFIDSNNPNQPGYQNGYLNGVDKAKTFAFRQATLGISHPLPIKGGTWGLQYIIGGENRDGLHQANQLVGSLGLTF
jgi:uncharacterized protein (TIGR02001 family)